MMMHVDMMLSSRNSRLGTVLLLLTTQGLFGQGATDVVARLVERVGDTENAESVCEQLERMGSVAVEALIPVLGEPNAYREQEQRALHAAYVLGRMRRGAIAAVDPLIELAVAEGEGRVQHQALWALGEILPWASQSVRQEARSRLWRDFELWRGLEEGELAELQVVLHRLDLGRPAGTVELRRSLRADGASRVAALRTIAQGLAESSEELVEDLAALGLEVADPTTEVGAVDVLFRHRLPIWAVDHAEASLMAMRRAEWDRLAPIQAMRLMSWDERAIEHALVATTGNRVDRGFALMVAHVLQTRGTGARLRGLELLSRDVRSAVASFFVIEGLREVEGAVGDAASLLSERMFEQIEGLDLAVAAVRGLDARVPRLREHSHLVLDLVLGAFLAGEITLDAKAAAVFESLDLTAPDVFSRVCHLYECLDNEGCQAFLAFLDSGSTRLPRGETAAEELLEAVRERGGFGVADRILAAIALFEGVPDASLVRVCEAEDLPFRFRAVARVAERPRVAGLAEVENVLVEGMRCDGEWESGNFTCWLPNERTHAFRFVSAVACLRHEVGDREFASQVVDAFLDGRDSEGDWTKHRKFSEAWYREVIAVGVAAWEDAGR